MGFVDICRVLLVFCTEHLQTFSAETISTECHTSSVKERALLTSMQSPLNYPSLCDRMFSVCPVERVNSRHVIKFGGADTFNADMNVYALFRYRDKSTCCEPALVGLLRLDVK